MCSARADHFALLCSADFRGIAGGKGRGGKGPGADKGERVPPDSDAIVKLLRAYEKHTGKSLDEVVALAVKPPEQEPADLSRKSLPDLLGRETREKVGERRMAHAAHSRKLRQAARAASICLPAVGFKLAHTCPQCILAPPLDLSGIRLYAVRSNGCPL